jgi:hypothetical protein
MEDTTSIDAARDAQRRLSARVFSKAQYRIEVMAAIAEGDGLVNLSELADLLGNPPGTGSVGTELKTLRRAGLLASVEGRRSDRKKFFRRRDSPLWETSVWLRDHADELLDAAHEQGM